MTAAIEIDGLRWRYAHDGPAALDGVRLRVEPGERVALLGPNGAGKTTLLLHLAGILAESPVVRVFGMPAAGATLPEVRRSVGLVFQDPDDQLFMPTVAEDVGFGPAQAGLPPAEVAARVREALAAVGLSGFEDRAPHRLSGGEKRRVALAGVLAMRPRVLALDEPAVHLDARGRRRLVDILRGLDATLLLATHDLALARELCERGVVMEAGRIVADAPLEALLADEAALRRHGLVA